MHKKNIYLFIYLAILYSCTKIVPLNNIPADDKLVLNSILNPDSAITVYLSKTSAILDTNIYWINDAEIEVYKNDIFEGLLTNIAAGKYMSSVFPEEGATYSLKINYPGYETPSSSDSIPKMIPLNYSTYTTPVGFDESGFPISEAYINFSDPINQKNYYELIFLEEYNNVLDVFNYFLETDPAFNAEGAPPNYYGLLYFSDELFNGSVYTFKMKFSAGYQMDGDGEYIDSGPYYIVLRSISENYYLYKKSLAWHLFTQGNSISDINSFLVLGDPVDMYSNIENGYGIFASYSSDTTRLHFIP